MLIYNYDSKTGEYIGTSEARLDPLESKKQGIEIFLIPANSTIEKPPEPKENEIVIIDNGKWIYAKESPEQIVEKEKETLIQAKIREIAIMELYKEGKLTLNGDLVKPKK